MIPSSPDLRVSTIADAMSRDRNNFDLVRLGLALAVVVSHAFSITTGVPDHEPLKGSTGFTLGEHAVNGFFAISGFLVTMSFDRRDWRDYVVARILRIAPALIAATLAVGLVLGLGLTRLPVAEYLASSALWRFVTATLTTFKSNTSLPDVFVQNPIKAPLATVWTLRYEVFCYLGVLVFGLAGLLRRRRLAVIGVAGLAIVLAVLGIVDPNASKGVETALRLPLIFAAGGAAYLWRDRLPLSAGLAAVLLVTTALLHGTFAYRPALFLAETYGVLWLGLARNVLFIAPKADLSYGTYLYGWPLQQSLVALFPSAAALTLLAPALALTLMAASMSWYLVEKPSLALKARILGGERRERVEPVPSKVGLRIGR
jgi:peptidoglycan/LPS O-acetylase OafA/YrhL